MPLARLDARQDRVRAFRLDDGNIAARSVSGVTVVVATQHVGVELGPLRFARLRLAEDVERVARRAQRHQRPTRVEVFADRRELRFGQRQAADEQHEAVGVFQLVRGRNVGSPLPVQHRHVAAVLLSKHLAELGQGLVGPVVVVADEDRHAQAFVFREPKRRPAHEVAGGDRRAPVLLDVFHDQFGPADVGNLGRHLRVVHAVGHVAHQHDVESLPHQLANPERPAEDAHVRVHAHDDHVLDPPLPHQVVSLGAVGDRVARHDFQRGDLPCPGALRLVRFGTAAV